MKKLLLLIVPAFIMISCKKEEFTVKGRLYYTPNCSIINGHIYISGSADSVKVFKQKVDAQFQGTNVPVWVTYVVDGNQQQNQQAGCEFGEVIKIKKLEPR